MKRAPIASPSTLASLLFRLETEQAIARALQRPLPPRSAGKVRRLVAPRRHPLPTDVAVVIGW